MLHSVEFLCSVFVAFARLVHALMSLCSPRSALQAIAAGIPPARAIKKVRPVMAVAVTALLDDASDQLLAAQAPPVLVLPTFKSTAKRPTRLVIPPPVAHAGVNPFGEAACRETEVAAEVEAQGEGFWVASRRGVRHAMEDAYGVITDGIAGDSQLAFYGVYDGHGGRAAVDLIADKLGKNIVAALAAQLELDVMAAIRAGYLATDSEFLSQGTRGGACAATALVKDGELYVANVGDCRAVLGTRDGIATALTSDHTPGREDERLRIESSGGYVSRGSGGVWRVQDSLAVSRAFGDANMRPWVTCEPEVTRLCVTPDCAFLVLASDGLWSKVSNHEAVEAVARSSGGGNAGVSMDSCKELVAMARSRGSRDDITAMVVDLKRFLR
ncbi:probable protein phosphatase 2C 77 [Lolium perenne]|uniref:probable protein phosphatase 2C 77 n=1 Tax=Lolium perenne TaxID=4522 RepID=UPI0021EACA0D|nr:probable protein phosphatase 2C 77 [Lolium perenne]